MIFLLPRHLWEEVEEGKKKKEWEKAGRTRTELLALT